MLHCAPEPVAEHAGDLVVGREPLVDERVVGRQQIEDVRVVAHDAIEQQLRLAAQRDREGSVVVRIEQRVGRHGVEPAKPEPLGGEARRERLRARIREHSRHLVLELVLRVQSPFTRGIDQLLIGQRAP